MLNIPTLKLNDYEAKEIVKILRDWTELSQEDFGKIIDRKKRTVQHYEGGTVEISLSKVLKIAKKYGIEIIAYKK